MVDMVVGAVGVVALTTKKADDCGCGCECGPGLDGCSNTPPPRNDPPSPLHQWLGGVRGQGWCE